MNMILEKIVKIANKHLPLIKALTLIWFLLITVLCIMPQNDLPKGPEIPYFDKFIHFMLYFVLVTLSLFVFSASKHSNKIILISIIFAFSFFIEVIQGILPFGRTFSLLDLLANLSGILAGLLLFQRKLNTYPVNDNG
ncbi:MAG: VanZ family protein [Mangrovibacterium sp.]